MGKGFADVPVHFEWSFHSPLILFACNVLSRKVMCCWLHRSSHTVFVCEKYLSVYPRHCLVFSLLALQHLKVYFEFFLTISSSFEEGQCLGLSLLHKGA